MGCCLDRGAGWSKVFWQPIGIGPVPPAVLYNFESFNLFIVPEPNTISLLALGSLALVWSLRRRRE